MTPDLVSIPGGTYLLGSDRHEPEEAPVHPVRVDGFEIARTEVTNREYARFVTDTGYVTVAERPLDPADYPGAPVENLQPGSMVFVGTPGPVDLRHLSQWWAWVPGASWRHPEGRRSSIDARMDHPVVHVAHEDAAAYADWAGLSLPTEAEWEVAARGGIEGASFTWGDEPDSEEHPLANYYRGDFPWRPRPGWGTTRPVGSFPANGYGLYDMLGNVRQWCWDFYNPGYYASSQASDPKGPASGYFYRVLRGGGWLDLASVTRCSYRFSDWPDDDHLQRGFRLARKPSP